MRMIAAAAAAAAFLATAPQVSAGTLGPFTDLVVFGDSLSDPGNVWLATEGAVPDPALYPNGQFTNGDTWATQLGADLGSGTNFAFGGAKAVTDDDDSPDFAAQRELYAAAAPSLGRRPLTAVFLGGNDLRTASDVAEGGSVIAAATSAIAGGVDELIDSGLENFLIIGLPNLGRLPDIAGSPAASLARDLTVAWNAALQAAVAPFGSRADLIYFDTFGIFEGIFADPGAYGISNTTDACLDSYPLCNAANAGSHVFFDNLHPTETVHDLYAREIAAKLAPIPLPASLPLAAMGFVLLLGAGYRSR